MYFGDVDTLDMHSVNWHLQYYRNDEEYQMLISICYLVVNGLLHSAQSGSLKFTELDEPQMARLYEKFILARGPGERSKYQIVQKQAARFCVLLAFVVSGSYLSSRAVASQVLSAYKGLTSVFGMGTGGTPWLNHRNGYGVFSTHLENCIAFQFASIKPSTY